MMDYNLEHRDKSEVLGEVFCLQELFVSRPHLQQTFMKLAKLWTWFKWRLLFITVHVESTKMRTNLELSDQKTPRYLAFCDCPSLSLLQLRGREIKCDCIFSILYMYFCTMYIIHYRWCTWCSTSALYLPNLKMFSMHTCHTPCTTVDQFSRPK